MELFLCKTGPTPPQSQAAKCSAAWRDKMPVFLHDWLQAKLLKTALLQTAASHLLVHNRPSYFIHADDRYDCIFAESNLLSSGMGLQKAA